MQKALEELLLKECNSEDLRKMLADPTLRISSSLSDEAKHVLGVIEELGHIHLDLHKKAEVLVSKGMGAFEKFFRKKYQITREEFFALRKNEIKDALTGGNVPIEKARARIDGCTFVRHRGVWDCVYGKTFLRWKRRIEQTESNFIKGTVAYSGVIRGRVVRHMSWTGITKIPEGAILVTGMTNPQIIPFIKNAAAIVTDEGGLMCHAAIISREMQKPCIVGTGTVTRFLKDGDFVEVDANKGVVRIIETKQNSVDSVILEKVRNLHWVLSWSGNTWPLLDTYYQYVPEFHKEWMQICGVPWSVVEMVFNKNRSAQIFTAEEGEVEMKDSFLKKLKADPQFIVRSADGYRDRVNSDLVALRRIFKIQYLEKLSNEKLVDLFIKARSHFYFNAMVDRYDYHMETMLTPTLEEYLKKRLGELDKQDMLAEYMNTLITPHQPSIISIERNELSKIVNWIRQDQQLTTKIKQGRELNGIISASPELNDRLQEYLKRWVWMPVLVNNSPATKESVWEEIRTAIVTEELLTAKSTRLGDKYDQSVIAQSKKYISELTPPPKILHLIEGLRAMAFLRTEDYVVMSESSYYVIPLYTEIARRLGIVYHDLKEFRPEEVVDYLELGKRVTSETLQKRISFNCLLIMGQDQHFFEGDEARKIWKIVSKQINAHRKKKQEYIGSVANKGKVSGKVRVALDMDSVKKLQPGEILVVSQVSAGFVPYMRRAGGILAEYGGLTSHPVIVAREFNIPCIVGIKGLTAVLKNGDSLVVDADTGFVKIF